MIRYAGHKSGEDELEKVMVERATMCSKYIKGRIPSLVHYPNCRYAPAVENWINTKNICEVLEDLHQYMDEIPNCHSPIDLFDKVWDVKTFLHRNAEFYFWGYKKKIQEPDKMEKKLKEHLKLC